MLRARIVPIVRQDRAVNATISFDQKIFWLWLLAGVVTGTMLAQTAPAAAKIPSENASIAIPAAGAGHFVDVTKAVHVDFHHQAGHTAKKYLLETMGSGVAVFDFDNDGLLDIFFANGAPIFDPEPPGYKPVKNGATSLNRLFHQKKDIPPI